MPSEQILLLGSDQADPDSVADQTGDVVDAKSFHQQGPVRLHRLDADAEPPGDRLGRRAFGDQLEDLLLPRRQAARRAGLAARLPAVIGDEVLRDRRAEVGLPRATARMANSSSSVSESFSR